MLLNINVQIDCPEAKPMYAHFGDGGADLRTMKDIEVRPGDVVMVPTGVRVEIPFGYAAFLMSRSGQGKVRVSLANSVGLIDHLYRKEIFAMLTNEGLEEYKAKKFDRIGQLVIVPVVNAVFNVQDQINTSDRGGFGSSGVA